MIEQYKTDWVAQCAFTSFEDFETRILETSGCLVEWNKNKTDIRFVADNTKKLKNALIYCFGGETYNAVNSDPTLFAYNDREDLKGVINSHLRIIENLTTTIENNVETIENLRRAFDAHCAESKVLGDAMFKLIEPRLETYLPNAFDHLFSQDELERMVDEAVETGFSEMTEKMVFEVNTAVEECVEDALSNLRVEVSTR